MRVDGSGRGHAGVGGIGPHPVQLGPLLIVLLHNRRAYSNLFDVFIAPVCFFDLIVSMSLVGYGVRDADLLFFFVWEFGHVDVEERAPSWQPGL